MKNESPPAVQPVTGPTQKCIAKRTAERSAAGRSKPKPERKLWPLCEKAVGGMWETLPDADVDSFKEELGRRLPWLPPGFKVGRFRYAGAPQGSISFTILGTKKMVHVAVDADDAIHRDDEADVDIDSLLRQLKEAETESELLQCASRIQRAIIRVSKMLGRPVPK